MQFNSENGSSPASHDFELGISGFRFSDLFDAIKLAELTEIFYSDVAASEPVVGAALKKYIDTRGDGFEKRAASKILTDAAPFLSAFIARLFHIEPQRNELEKELLIQTPIWRFKFFVQRRAIKQYKADQLAALNENELWMGLTELRNNGFDATLVRDEELSIAELTAELLDAEEALTKDAGINASKTVAKVNRAFEKLKDKTFGRLFSQYVLEEDGTGDVLTVKAALHLVEAWSAAAFFSKSRRWYSFRTPHALDYQNLVHLIHPDQKLHNIMRGADSELRRRDGFKLTDDRGTMRDALFEVDYCLICHERDKDSCSTGLREPRVGSTPSVYALESSSSRPR